MNSETMSNKFYSHGKLLLTGEYVVLDGAKALAVPTKFGQEMEVLPIDENKIEWLALDENGKPWFEGIFLLPNSSIFNLRELQPPENRNPTSHRLIEILRESNQLNPNVLKTNKGYKVITKTEFPQNWGLGTSSTLLNNIAQWFQIDAFGLSEKTFGGSGYDIACAQRELPIVYQLEKGKPKIREVDFLPKFSDELFFVHLNQKQDSRNAIRHYRHQQKSQLSKAIGDISNLTEAFVACTELSEFEEMMAKHEKIIASLLNIEPVKTRLFNDYPHAIKSLGGWGGDFVLVVGGKKEMDYFWEKGYHTMLGFDEMFGD